MRSHAHSYTAKRNIRVWFAVLFLLFLAIVCAWVVGQVFVLKRIEVVGDKIDIEVDRERLGKNMLFLQTGVLERELLSAYPLIGSVKFSKSLPSTLVLHVTLRQPYAVLVSGNTLYAIDSEGVVLGNQSIPPGLVQMHFDVPTISIGSRVADPRVKNSLTLLRSLRDIAITEMRDKDGAAIQASMEHTNIFFPQFGDMSSKATTLQTIVAGFRIKGTLPTVIDLRFDKPIVTY